MIDFFNFWNGLFSRRICFKIFPFLDLRKFLRLGSPLCSSSSYAMLRPVSRGRTLSDSEPDMSDSNVILNESFDERNRKRAMSLRIFDGDIRLSCGGSGKSTFVEESEIDFDESTDGSNKIVVDSNEKQPVDSISVSSELDRELEASDMSGDSQSFTSHEGVEDESSSDFQIDFPEVATPGSSSGIDLSVNSEIVTKSDIMDVAREMIVTSLSNDSAMVYINVDARSNDAATRSGDAATGSNYLASEASLPSNKFATLERNEKENGCTLEDLKAKEIQNEKRKGRIFDSLGSSMENFDKDEKEIKILKAEENVETRALNAEMQGDEKPAGIETSLKESEAEINKQSEMKKAPSRIGNKGPINHDANGKSLVKRSDSTVSSLWLSNDDEELGKDLTIKFYEAELSRSRERLEGEPPSQNVIKCLVSLTTPRDLLSVSSCEQPAFVEFDMSRDGFGYLFVGSLTPFISQSKFPFQLYH